VAALVLALGALILAAGSAAAHVTVNPREARPNTSETFWVRVPTEKDEPTVRVRVEFPATLTVSRFQPKPGWQREIERDAAGRITAVIWSGGRIEPGEYDDFYFIARTPADAGELSFRAMQTYLSGDTHEWAEAEGAQRPAAIVEVRAAAAAGGNTNDHGQAVPIAGGAAAGAPAGATARAGSAPAGTGSGAQAAAADGAGPQAGGGSDLPLFVALGAAALALVGIAMSGIALARRPQPA
jgi:uncharacterized protein YcnI